MPEVPAGGDVEAQPDDEASDSDLPGWQFDGQQGSQDYIGMASGYSRETAEAAIRPKFLLGLVPIL